MQASQKGLVQNSMDIPAVSRDLIVEAVRGGWLVWLHIPLDLQNDMEFCRLLLDPKELNWEQRYESGLRNGIRMLSLSEYYTHTPDFVRLAAPIFERHPQLGRDNLVRQKILAFHDLAGDLHALFAMGHVPTDRNLVKRACILQNVLVTRIDQLAFVDFVKERVDEDPNLLVLLTHDVIDAHEEFFKAKIVHVDPGHELRRTGAGNPTAPARRRRFCRCLAQERITLVVSCLA